MSLGFCQTEKMFQLYKAVQLGVLIFRQPEFALTLQQLRNALLRFGRRTKVGNLFDSRPMSDEVDELHVDGFGCVHSRLLHVIAAPAKRLGHTRAISVYELRTSAGFSGLTRHFRPLKTLQLTHSALFVLIVVRIHAGEPLIFALILLSVRPLLLANAFVLRFESSLPSGLRDENAKPQLTDGPRGGSDPDTAHLRDGDYALMWFASGFPTVPALGEKGGLCVTAPLACGELLQQPIENGCMIQR